MTRVHLLAVGSLLIAAGAPQVAFADVAFAQSKPNNYGIRYTQSGSTASITDIATAGHSDLLVNLTLQNGSVVSALFDLTGSTAEAATQFGTGIYEEGGLSGNFSLTDAMTGQDYLTGTYLNATITGSGTSGSFFSTLNSTVTYTSGSEAVAGLGGFSIALNNANHPFSASAGGPLNSFNARTGGTFNSAAAVPEISTWAMMIAGFGGIGMQARRAAARSRRRAGSLIEA